MRGLRGTLAGLAAGMLALLAVPVAAVAAPGDAETSSVFLAGTGKVSSKGDTARIDVSIECPKGVTWSLPEGSIFGFAEIGRDDTFATVEANQSGKCTGKLQKTKISIAAFYNPPIPRNCSAEYGLTVSFSDGSQVFVQKGIGGPANGPEICLS